MNEKKGFLIFLIALFGILSFLMLKPYFSYVLGSVIFAFILYPLQQKFEPHIGEKTSSMFVVFFSIAVFILPVLLGGGYVWNDAKELANELENVESINLTKYEKQIEKISGQEVNTAEILKEGVKRFSKFAIGNFSGLIGIVSNLFIGLSLMIFILYYLVKDGDELVTWSKKVIPLPKDIQDNLHNELKMRTWAVMKGHVFVAIVQGLIAGLGLYLAGIESAVFWTFVMIILGFIPIIGSSLIWMPAGVYLIITGSPTAGIFLLLYGSVVVGLTDNFLRPIIVDQEADLHPAAIIIGVIGGVNVFGAPGLFIGPVIIGVFKSTLVVFRENYEHL